MAPSDDVRWRQAVDAVRTALPRHGKSLSYAHFLGFSAEGARIGFGPDAAFHRAQVMGTNRALIEKELSSALRRPISLSEDTNAEALKTAPQTIAQEDANNRSARERRIEDKVKSHPALRSVLKHLGGTVEHITFFEPEPKPGAAVEAADDGDAGPPVE